MAIKHHVDGFIVLRNLQLLVEKIMTKFSYMTSK